MHDEPLPEMKSQDDLKTFLLTSMPEFFRHVEGDQKAPNAEAEAAWNDFKSGVWLLVKSLSISQWFIIFKMYLAMRQGEAAEKAQEK